MLSYKDKTFCQYYLLCKDGPGCSNALTPEIVEAARVWWKSFNSKDGVPIAQWASQPECFKVIWEQPTLLEEVKEVVKSKKSNKRLKKIFKCCEI